MISPGSIVMTSAVEDIGKLADRAAAESMGDPEAAKQGAKKKGSRKRRKKQKK